MADIRHHCSFELSAGGQSHQVEVWCLIDPGEPGNYGGHPDQRYPADPARVVEWTAVHLDEWPLFLAKEGTLRLWFSRHRDKIEGNVLADWQRARREEAAQ